MSQRFGKTILIFSQTFVPDPASVGQHMADVAIELGRRGHRVRVYTANRGYDDATVKYEPRQTIGNVQIRRLPFSHFGKKNLFIRAIGTLTFMIQCIWIALTSRNVGGIFFSTSPPLIGFAAAMAKIMRGIPIAYWAMDLNPDQLIAMGKIKATSLTSRILEKVNRNFLHQSSLVVALDRFMAGRLRERGVGDDKLLIMPPWSHEDHMHPSDSPENTFRIKHNVQGKFIVMYSGNHSPANPLQTVLEAAIRLKDQSNIHFMFIGGGLGKRDVEAAIKNHNLQNITSLPYQPLDALGDSLGAADVHVVSLGQNMVGIIHPCKIYGAMTVGRPILFVGPKPSHVADLLEHHDIGKQVDHGNVDDAVAAILQLQATPADKLRQMGLVGQQALHQDMGQAILCKRLCDRLEDVFDIKGKSHEKLKSMSTHGELRCAR